MYAYINYLVKYFEKSTFFVRVKKSSFQPMIFQNPFENWIHSSAGILVQCEVRTRGLLYPSVVIQVDDATRFIVVDTGNDVSHVDVSECVYMIGQSKVHCFPFVTEGIARKDAGFFYHPIHVWEGRVFEAYLTPRHKDMKALGTRHFFAGRVLLAGVSLRLP